MQFLRQFCLATFSLAWTRERFQLVVPSLGVSPSLLLQAGDIQLLTERSIQSLLGTVNHREGNSECEIIHYS